MSPSRVARIGQPTKAKPRILIVDDDLETSNQLSVLLTGYACERVASGSEALRTIERRPFDVVISDIRMDGMSGLELLDRLVELKPRLPVVLCTGFSALSGAVEATKRGAFEYLEKPYDLHILEGILVDALRSPRAPVVTTAIEARSPLRLTRARQRSPRSLSPLDAAPSLLGEAPAMLALMQDIRSVGASSAPVFISGESGTGKDLVAHAIHAASARRDLPFVAVNVSAIPEHLLESELFGHVRGAFSGASEARRGLLLEAHGGTLFLDEIGDMPVSLQAKLLRVLQSGELRAVGSDTTRTIDVRIVTATHRDLRKWIELGHFREDLYYRIHVLPVAVPPLRERRGDIATLARHFLAGARQRTPTSPVRHLSEEAEHVLSSAPWPGNVRELESALERLVVFGREETIDAEALHFLPRPMSVVGPVRTGHLSLRDVNERHVSDVLATTGGDKRRAAEILGIDLSTLYRWKHRPAPS